MIYRTGQTLRFRCGNHILIAFDRDSVGTFLAVLLDKGKASFVVATFKYGDDDYGNVQKAPGIFTALKYYQERLERIGGRVDEE